MPKREWKSIPLFVALTLGLAGLYGAAAWKLGAGFNRDIWGAVRGFIPAVAALIATTYEGGPGVLKRIGIRPGRPGGAPSLYTLAILGPALVMAAALLGASMLMPADWTGGVVQPGRFLLFFFLMIVVDGPLGEEVGWRGFMLPRLLHWLSPLWASMMVGTVWFLWHLPLYAADGVALTGGFLASFLAQLLATATIYTWFALRSGQSLLLAIVLHDASNYVQFLAAKAFPAMTQGDTADHMYQGIVIILGCIAGAALQRTPRTQAP